MQRHVREVKKCSKFLQQLQMDNRAAGNVSPCRHKFTRNQSCVQTDGFTHKPAMDYKGGVKWNYCRLNQVPNEPADVPKSAWTCRHRPSDGWSRLSVRAARQVVKQLQEPQTQECPEGRDLR